MPKKVFVSYSRRNYDFAEKLVASLQEEGFEVWFDYHLLSGEDWDDSLEEQIRKCDVLIVILSKPSVASDNVKNEVCFALDLGKPVHPILMEECSVPLSMRRMHYVDFTKLDYEEATERLANDLNEPPTNSTEHVPKTVNLEKSKTKYLFPAIIGLVLIAVLSWWYWPTKESGGLESTTNSDKQENVFKDDINWRKVNSSNQLSDYVDYLVKNENSEGRLDNAVGAIQDLLKAEGAVIMKKEDTYDWFLKFASKGNDGYVLNGKDTNTELPLNGDLLVTKKRLTIVDPETFDVVGGIFLSPGDIVQFSESTQDDSHTMWTFYYETKETPSE